MARPHFIVFANEKGGTGKSTTAVHSAVALAAAGRRVAAIDLDTRQRTLGRYLDNRAATIRRTGAELPMPAYETFDPEKNRIWKASSKRFRRAPRSSWSIRPGATIRSRARRCFAPTRSSPRSTTASSISI
jgi:anion-transporting  ArsA/GET3 family ATPase